MAIMRWDPFGEMLRMQTEMDRIFSRLGGATAARESADRVAWMPRIDVVQKGDDILISAEVPGVAADDVDIELTEGVLTIRGERKMDETAEGEGYILRERSYGSFERSLSLPEGIDPASISAAFEDGVLEVRVPKALEVAKPKTTKIPIGTGEVAVPPAPGEGGA